MNKILNPFLRLSINIAIEYFSNIYKQKPSNQVQTPDLKAYKIKSLNIYLTGFGNLLGNQTRCQKNF